VCRQEGQTTVEVGVWDKGNLTGGVMVQQINGQSSVKISGNVIDINGSNITISADRIDINGLVSKLQTEQLVAVSMHTTGGSNLFEGANSFPDTVTMQDLTYANNAVEWKSQTVVTSVSVSNEHTYLYGDANVTPTGRSVGRVVLSTPSTSTIYCLGRS
jgi:hypothetical protein